MLQFDSNAILLVFRTAHTPIPPRNTKYICKPVDYPHTKVFYEINKMRNKYIQGDKKLCNNLQYL